MGIHVAIEHRTHYSFDRLVELSPHVVRLRPAPHCRTPILAYSLAIEPAGHFVNWQQDPFGNHQARLVFPEKATALSLQVGIVADLGVINPFDFFVEPSAERYPFAYERSLARDLGPYLAVE
jgi:transglutaminase-like putative cysteine protease